MWAFLRVEMQPEIGRTISACRWLIGTKHVFN